MAIYAAVAELLLKVRLNPITTTFGVVLSSFRQYHAANKKE